MSGIIYSGKYEIQELIAQGGMGAVYKALDQKLNRIVALKVVHPHLSGDQSFLKRFLREARDMARLPHENIVTIFSVEQDQATHYLVMEYFPGTNLRDMINSDGAAPLSQAVNITRQIANALSYAHSHGIIHRDIKPANVLVGDKNRAKLTDFGIAAALDHAPLTSTGQIIGSLPYMPPEQARDAALDGRSDLYSLGMTFYELLTGVNPRRNLSNTVILGMLLSEDKTPPLEFPSSIPSEIQLVIKDLLKYRPTDRIQDADSLLERLEALRPIWSSSSTGNKAADDSPTIIKSVSQKTAAARSNSDDKTVAVLDPRLASRSKAPAPEKPTRPERRVNKKAAVHVALSAAVLLGLAIGGYYYSITQHSTEETSSDRTPAMTAQAPQQASKEVPKIGEPFPNQAPSQGTNLPRIDGPPEVKPSSQDKFSVKNASPKERTGTQEPSDKTPMRGQKPSGTIEKTSTTEKTEKNKVPPLAKTPQRNTKVPTEKPAAEETPPQATMPVKNPNEATEKSLSGKTVGQDAEPKVAMAVNSAREIQALMALLEELRTGIVNKDLPAVERMSLLSDNRRRFLEAIFENYSSIDVSFSVVDQGPTEAKAILLINKLVLPTGETIDPTPLVRRTTLTIARDGDNWGRIIW